MAIVISKSGAATAADLRELVIYRDGDGTLTAQVIYVASIGGRAESRTARWTLTAAERGAIAALVPGALAAVDAAS